MSRQSYAEVWTYADPLTENLRAAKQLEVTVYKAGTTEKATIYEAREGGGTMSNPFISKENGLVLFWAATGEYDIKFHDTILPARFGDFTIGWLSAPLNVEIDAGELSNKGDVEWTQEVNGAWLPQLKPGVVGLNELENAAFIPQSRLTAEAQQRLFSSGDIKVSALPSAPTGWLLCNGASKLISEYTALYSAIGWIYGKPDANHFNLPNLESRVAIGNSASWPLGTLGGEFNHVLSAAEMPYHTHDTAQHTTRQHEPNNMYGLDLGQFGFSWIVELEGAYGNQTGAAGSSWAHNNMQPFQSLNFFIKT